ncbi:Phospholipase/Carboxylesterase family protein [Planoprotostelium fungivorum]|uniref:Phospholipase/Carboxylesterase family protein n=1 Tax=Planoprotostelium fungivorum TaxID=1890364 RepID=A0A2P6NXW5_9EUKA|nr:Phospholipase/Carboxylesterase family protein [Planoprotostelium fungivorum]
MSFSSLYSPGPSVFMLITLLRSNHTASGEAALCKYLLNSNRNSGPWDLMKRAKVLPPRGDHKYTIVWMHGLGDSSEGFRDLFEQFVMPNTRVVLLNAPVMPVTANGGMRMQSWYDIRSFDRSEGLNRDEDHEGIDQAADAIKRVLEEETKRVESNRVIVGGFSQGAAMTLRVSLPYEKKLGGITPCSGYLLQNERYPGLLGPHARETPILAYHGAVDEVVPLEFAEVGYKKLMECGVKENLDLRVERRLGHSMSNSQISELFSFMSNNGLDCWLFSTLLLEFDTIKKYLSYYTAYAEQDTA